MNLTLQDIMDQARAAERRKAYAPKTLTNRQLFTLFKRDSSGNWNRFTSTALTLDEAMRNWPDLPGNFCIRPTDGNAVNR